MPGATRATAGVLAAALAGAIVYLLVLGAAPLRPSNVGWLFNGGIDPSTHFVGAHMFRYAAWDWPPGGLRTLGHPVGTSVALTDSVPLVALPLKLAGGVLPEVFQYFGLWLLACFVLQGLFGALLVGTATSHPWTIAAGGTVFVLSPLLVHRTGHAALTAHWVLLAALWLALRPLAGGGRPPGMFRPLAPWLALCGVTAAIHPYLAVMVVTLAAAAGLAQVRSARDVLGRVLVPAIGIGAAVWCIWWLAGYFVVPTAGDLQSVGFGQFSLNLLSPIVPFDEARLARYVHLRLPSYEQYEGFGYFGPGGLFLFGAGAVAWATGPKRLPIPAVLALAIACLGLTVFALSPVVMLGDRVLFEYPGHWWGPLATFRVSGRMFWPAYYALVFGAVALVARRWSQSVALVVIGAAVTLQLADLWPVYETKRASVAAPLTNPHASPFWRRAFAHYRHVVLRPSNMCVPWPESLDFRFLALHAGPAGATINGGFAARYDVEAVTRYCERYAEDGRSGTARDDTIYVFLPGFESTLASSSVPVRCLPVDGLVACMTEASYKTWEGEDR